jgi:predicted enzyme related to lactoylglutathione lyase
VKAPRVRELGIQGLGWVIRRFAEPAEDVVAFYQPALQLQSFRPRPPGNPAVMLWAGDLTMVELSRLQPAAGTEARLHDMSLVMRTADCGLAMRHLVDSGAAPASRDHGPTRAATFVDPFGRLLGLQATDGQGDACGDPRVAAAAEAVPAALVPGAAPRPASMPDVFGIDLAVVDPVAIATFYGELFGLEPLGRISRAGAQLSLGRRARLRLLPGGRRHAVPADRDQVPDVWALRVRDHAAMSARLEALKVPVVTVRRLAGGIITYAVDPEGHLFGFQQRTPDLLKPGEAERVEDALANRLWAGGQ